jgi:transposase
VDRRKSGSKHHVITDAEGVPLAVRLTGGNRHDVTELIPLVDSIPAIAGKVGHPIHRPEEIFADRAYDSEPHREQLRARGIQATIAQRNTEHGSGLGVYRWVVERTISWLHQFRRLRIRYERRADIHMAFLTLGRILICYRHWTSSFC